MKGPESGSPEGAWPESGSPESAWPESAWMVAALGALAHAHRLAAYRLLVEAGPDGVAAGVIAARLGIAPSSLSFHMQGLLRAGLVVPRRESRHVIYAAEFDAMNRLVGFLLKDCCGRGDAGPIACNPTPRPDPPNPARRADLASPACDVGLASPGAPRRPERKRPLNVTIYHNPACGTSRNVLAHIRAAGIEPVVIEYLKTPPTRAELRALIARMGVKVRAVLREKGTPYAELGLGEESLSDEALLDAMMAHPILINRPIVVTDQAVRLCRPSETVLPLLAA